MGQNETGDEQSDKLHEHQVNAGRAGGRSRSNAKREAVRANLASARLKRWPGREAAAIAQSRVIEVPEREPEREVEDEQEIVLEVDPSSNSISSPSPSPQLGSLKAQAPRKPSLPFGYRGGVSGRD